MMTGGPGPDPMGKPRNKKMSFDDLGKVYHNISRKRILSKVSCACVRACAVPLAALRTTVWFKGSPEFSARRPGLRGLDAARPPWFKKRPNWNGFALLQQSTPFLLSSHSQ